MSFTHLRTHLLLLITLTGLLTSTTAWAWVERHVTSHEARVTLGRNGNARIDQVVGLKVRGGPLRTLDVEIADKKVTGLGDVSLLKKLGKMQAMQPVPASMEQRPDGSLRIEINEREGVRTGTYELHFSYNVDLLAGQLITKNGSMLSISWVQPKWGAGIDNDKCVFVVPTSNAPPNAGTSSQDHEETEEQESLPLPPPYLATLVRLPEVDEMTLLRPHVSKDEQVTWTIQVSPSTLADVRDPTLTAATTVTGTVQPVPRERRLLYLSIGAALALLVSVLLARKHHEVTRAARLMDGSVRPLIPVGIAVRVALAGPVLAAAVAAQFFLERPYVGTAGVMLATALIAYRTPKQQRKPRGPGKWLALSLHDALRISPRRPLGWLDLSSRGGKVLFALAAIGYGVGVARLSVSYPYYAYLMALDSVVFFAMFATGRWSEQPGDRLGRSVPWLQQLLDELRKVEQLRDGRISVVARYPKGSKEPDELRVRVIPKGAMRGVKSVEIGLGWVHGQGGSLVLPEVLVRVLDGSECHKAVTAAVGSPRWLRGRSTYERVLVLQPTLPTVSFTVQKVLEAVRVMRRNSAENTKQRRERKPTSRKVSPRSLRQRGAVASTC